jgi:hypothetical protein
VKFATQQDQDGLVEEGNLGGQDRLTTLERKNVRGAQAMWIEREC